MIIFFLQQCYSKGNPWALVSVSPGNLLGRQILRPHHRPPDSKPLGFRPLSVVTSPLFDSDASTSVKKMVL